MQIPARNGYLGILPGHAPLISELAVGQISYRNGSETHYLSVAWGFAEVLPDKVTILAEAAERAEDVDCDRARKAKERAEKALVEWRCRGGCAARPGRSVAGGDETGSVRKEGRSTVSR